MSRNFELLRRADVPLTGYAAAATPGRVVSGLPIQPGQPVMVTGGDTLELREINRIVSSLLAHAVTGRQTVLFADVERRGGSSRIVARIAETLMNHIAGKVLVVDANLTAPVVHQELGLANEAGLTECLLHDGALAEYLQEVNDRLSVLTAGNCPVTSVAPERLRERVIEMRQHFEMVLIDAPPIMGGPDAAALAQLTDGLVLVLQANSTRRETATRAKLSLEQAQVALLGVVLVDRELPIPEPIYRRL